ncbi:hypothetical protein DSECCO2_572330 [anaerobic digester metagenome]
MVRDVGASQFSGTLSVILSKSASIATVAGSLMLTKRYSVIRSCSGANQPLGALPTSSKLRATCSVTPY